VERLKLASAVFEVKSGLSRGELLAYPDILAHPVFDNHLQGPRSTPKAMRVWSLLDSRGTRVVELFCGLHTWFDCVVWTRTQRRWMIWTDETLG
jgi:hypothetical protein